MAPNRVDDALETIDPSAAPALLRPPVKPPDPKQDIDATHKGRQARGFGGTTSEWNPILNQARRSLWRNANLIRRAPTLSRSYAVAWRAVF